ncbi:MFS transporter [Treponema zuelzerae]|uniref:MFS transporter n=1 Tax=Teretinema zuelzerae TaxID=156 RepID=A0AAE3EJN9_9SPIR|nr:MFS transporter [Teretinema zuelzerae]MCD1655008.1 MFS transporter [Teretinema zuelzerae]
MKETTIAASGVRKRAERLPFRLKIVYALGQLGWSLGSYGAANFLNQYYLPFSENGAALYPKMIHQGYVIGVLTVIGLSLWFGRVFDAVTDPLIAVFSDRSKSRLGRRRSFMAVAAAPFALFAVLCFVPLFGSGADANTAANGVWLFVCITLLYWFMTMYVTPFFAWMSELGHDPDERLQLSTMISITWAVGAMLGAQAPVFQGMFQFSGKSAQTSFQLTMVAFGVVSFVLMILPVIFINEKRYCESVPSDEGFFTSLKTVISDKNFFIFTLSDFAYWISLYFINNGLMYYVTVLLGLPKETYSFLFIVMFLVSFLFYVPVNIIARRVGRRRLLIIAFCLFGLLFAFSSLFGIMPLPPMVQALIASLLAAIPLAVFGILPNAMISDMAEAWAIETGQHKAGVFFGFRTFMSKMGQSIGAVILPSLVMLGASASNGEVVGVFGVRLTTICALGFCVAGVLLLLRYDEKKVQDTLSRRT